MEVTGVVNQRNTLYHKLTHVRLSRLIMTLLVILIATPLVAHYYLSKITSDVDSGTPDPKLKRKNPLDRKDPFHTTDVKTQLSELHRIKTSVSNELRDLESKRQKLQSQISKYHMEIEKLRVEKENLEKDIKTTQLSLDQLRLERDELDQRYIPILKAPQQILLGPEANTPVVPPTSSMSCHMHSCFDYSRCSVLSRFPVYFYTGKELMDFGTIDSFIESSLSEILGKIQYRTYDPTSACVYLAVVGQVKYQSIDFKSVESALHNLPYWHGDGRNHVIINMLRQPGSADLFIGVNTGRAIIAQTAFTESSYRAGFDVLIPPSLGKISGDVWQELPPCSPVRRKYFLSFVGQYNTGVLQTKPIIYQNSNVNIESNELNHLFENGHGSDDVNYQNRNLQSINEKNSMQEGEDIDFQQTIVEYLKEMEKASDHGQYTQFSCDNPVPGALIGEWALCGAANERHDLLVQSTFSLIFAPLNTSFVSTTVFQIRLYESLKYGAVPVVLGGHMRLPFDEILDWRKSVIMLPRARLTEVHFILRTYTDNDIALMRRQGRFVYETYFGTSYSIFNTILAIVRTRLTIPAVPVADAPSPSVFNTTFLTLKLDGPEPNPETDEVLGPLENPFGSLKFKQNFTQYVAYQMFQHPGDPLRMFPNTPFEEILPSEAKFLGSGFGFRPVNKGEGGAGKEFSESLGGNVPREQFTIVMLTYERETVLIGAIQRLKGLPFLNKVLIVWNNPVPPSPELRWPEINVPILIVKTARNSLNNRFLPFDAIETEAILSIDDDAHLRHDEIIFAFRVWREERDRIVGFPGRFHAWDVRSNAWLYNSNYSCELSMVLTGAAFYHKYYAYLYTYSMPQAIRNKVDEFINCEDIAMNFLVSHITRKPPIKVTSRWTFRCPGCPQTLSNDSSHFEERHKCINFFVKVYGYMPLLYTQYRVDSVLFKTRLPHDKQKCFKFI
ncbi:exostosin-like 3 [Pecten maximus]|uniref:exostosin-like 3 n=1 Tax=Pecten maximus TaxID=6579 RepID=UPI0014586FBF|nr:exostosin-like 3 [Pecten maximus]XP_033726992.1 exostosin-like 3 [Pecten maximus]